MPATGCGGWSQCTDGYDETFNLYQNFSFSMTVYSSLSISLFVKLPPSLNAAGVDYVEVSNNLTFGPSSPTEQCVSITLLDDDYLEENETFSVSASTADSAVDIVSGTTVVTIVDNDSKNIASEVVLVHGTRIILYHGCYCS